MYFPWIARGIVSHRIYSEFKSRQTKRRGVRKNTTRRVVRGYRKLQRSTLRTHSRVPPVYTLFSRAGNRGLKYRDPTPLASRPRSMSAGRAHANIICESSVFRTRGRERRSGIPVRARGIHGTERRNGAPARGERRVRALYRFKWTIVLGDGSTTTLAETKRSRRPGSTMSGRDRGRPCRPSRPIWTVATNARVFAFFSPAAEMETAIARYS